MRTLAQVQKWSSKFGVNVEKRGREYEVWTSGSMTDVSTCLGDTINAVHEFISLENLHIQISPNDVFSREADNARDGDPCNLLYVISISGEWLYLNYVDAITLPGEEYLKVRIGDVSWISPTCFRYCGECYQWKQVESKIKKIVGYTVSIS